ncbi:hypothetical protein [Paenibacillus sp. NPDC093718]|uniref:hypothetical protein n=1 Tax=Paenibacillus sp. NPDC093718 TaxID=3390601 RepID=UPI003D05C757
MKKYVLVRKEDDGSDIFVRELSSEDSYTDDLGNALIFDSEYDAQRERIDDEKVAELRIDEIGWSYEVMS